ncbi:type II secretion system F family protein [Georhizobium profundi]|jgi:tight adherence protein C|uniref:Type II secretion system F family protein n=1 Tax=Georhizobium profundi TaxID=2341112 RepID=A0A3Q8XKX1_9HYPH|nr:type II secretion system F family protein [Georhizobium profundi]AZN69947.1 type II secretion system F family protein [Georhizobium profundi]
MFTTIINTATQPSFVLAVLVSISVFATLITFVMPYFERGDLNQRMKAVAVERDEIRARERARLNAEQNRRGSLRQENNSSLRQIVEKLNLRKALVDDNTVAKLRSAGYRSPNALNRFLLARFALPFFFLAGAVFYVMFMGGLAEQPFTIKLLFCMVAAYAGFYAPNLYVSNNAGKRQKSIRQAWPDALDLTLICVESGVSIEAALRRVADEIAAQSTALAEELVLTTAELSYLPERRQAYENLGTRTGLESVKSVSQALIQAERYGTPIAQALRVLAQESRDQRMTEAEKKAAALPPKLTVPMILFFLPVLFGVILGPAIIGVMDTF